MRLYGERFLVKRLCVERHYIKEIFSWKTDFCMGKISPNRNLFVENIDFCMGKISPNSVKIYQSGKFMQFQYIGISYLGIMFSFLATLIIT